jgi:hypothetical protein
VAYIRSTIIDNARMGFERMAGITVPYTQDGILITTTTIPATTRNNQKT